MGGYNAKEGTMTFKTFVNNKNWAVLIFTVFAIPFLTGAAYAQKFQFSVFGGINHVFKYGSEDDFVLGENHFPVTPTHTPPIFGASLSLFFSENLGLELDWRYVFSSKVILVDPSDQDTVEIDSSKHYSLTLNLLYQFMSGKLRPYVVAGGGFDNLSAEDATYTSEYGFAITLEAPEKTLDAVANFGAGMNYFVSDNLGLKLDVRYVMIFADPNNVNNLSAVFGVSFRF
jgi:outer membrane beta-barrel protein